MRKKFIETELDEVTNVCTFLKSINPKLAEFYKMFFVAMNRTDRRVSLPRRFVCESLKLKATRFSLFIGYLINLRLITEDLTFDATPKAALRLKMNTYKKSLVPALLSRDASQFPVTDGHRDYGVPMNPVPPLLDDPFDIEAIIHQPVDVLDCEDFSIREIYRKVKGNKISINGVSARAARKTSRKVLAKLSQSGSLEANSCQTNPQSSELINEYGVRILPELTSKGTRLDAIQHPQRIDKNRNARKTHLSEHRKRLYLSNIEVVNEYIEKVSTSRDIPALDVSDSFNPSTPSNEAAPGLDVQEVRMEAMSKPGLIPIFTAAADEAQFNVAELSHPKVRDSIPKSAGGACRANKRAFKNIDIRPWNAARIWSNEFEHCIPGTLSMIDRVRYIFTSYKKLSDKLPHLTRNLVPLPLANGTYVHKESRNELLDRIYEWAGLQDEEQWFARWTNVLARVYHNELLRGDLGTFAVTLDWLFREHKIVNTELEDVTSFGLNIDRLLGERAITEQEKKDEGDYDHCEVPFTYRRGGKVNWDEGFDPIFRTETLNEYETFYAHAGVIDIDPWFAPAVAASHNAMADLDDPFTLD
jgi:hypothetical protein